MAFLVTVVTGGPAHVPIFPTRWPVVATIILSRGFGRVDRNDRGGALRPRAAGAVIATISIVPTFLIVTARSLQDLSALGIMTSHGLCLLGAERKRVLVSGVILDRFWGGAVALRAASIYLMDLQKKVQGNLGLKRNSLLDNLVPGVFSTTFLLSLSTDGGPEAVAE